MSNKWVLLILDIIIITLIGVSAIKGLNIKQDLRISSVKETVQLDEGYQIVLQDYSAAKLKYEDALQSQKSAKISFENAKEEFEQLKDINSYETLVELATNKEFNVEALWIKLGLIAENNNLIHVFNIKRSMGTQNYDIHVELNGSYSGIRNFIQDIMMDMDLMFKAEDVIIQSSDKTIKATFVIKNVNIVM